MSERAPAWTVPQSCGHRLEAAHIEPPAREFLIAWEAPGYINVMRFRPGTRWARVYAQTPDGALLVARYHHSRGSGHRLLDATLQEVPS